MLIYLNGAFVPEEDAKVSVFDHGLLYGDGVFEGIRAYNGKVFRLQEHIDRMWDSAKTIDLKIPISKKEMAEIILDTLRKNDLKDAYIRPIITRGVGDLGLDPNKCGRPTIIVIATGWGAMYGDLYDKGLTAITCSIRRNPAEALPPNVKSLNYLNNIMAKIEAINSGVEEVIMLNVQGYVAEASGDNAFIFKDNRLLTPPTSAGALEGITRNIAMKLAGQSGYEVGEAMLTRYDLYNADEMFLTGTAAEIISVVEMDRRTIGSGLPGKKTVELTKQFRRLAAETGVPIR